MSNSITSAVQTDDGRASVPRAVIHKKILDAAAARPDASMEAIAEEVSGATTAIVEQVLEEYGDPATGSEESPEPKEPPAQPAGGDDRKPDHVGTDEDGHDDSLGPEGTPTDTSSGTDSHSAARDALVGDSASDERPDSEERRPDPAIEPADLTEKQLETLEEITRQPTATQAKLAETLGVTSATINQRVNAIDGFDWSARREFVAALFDESDGPHDEQADAVDRSDDSDEVEDVADASNEQRRPRGSSDSQRSTDSHRASGSRGASDTHDRAREEPTDQQAQPAAAPDALATRLDRLTRNLESLEERLGDSRPRGRERGRGCLAFEPELLHKILHACLTADNISEEEELRILKAITGDAAEPA